MLNGPRRERAVQEQRDVVLAIGAIFTVLLPPIRNKPEPPRIGALLLSIASSCVRP